MRIGFDITAIAGGRGPGRFAGEMLTSLCNACTDNDEILGYCAHYPRNLGTLPRFTVKHIPKRAGVPWLNATLPFFAWKDQVDVMYFPANDFWIVPVVPTIATLLDVAPVTVLKDYHNSLIDKIQAGIQIKMVKYVAKSIITISQYSADEIISIVPGVESRISVIHCGLTRRFQNPPGNVPRTGYLLFVGGFDKRKNLYRLLTAYKKLLSAGRKERLLLVGNSGANSRLYYNMPEVVRELGLSEWVDIRTGVGDHELPELYAGAELLVLPSLVEGFGLPVIEAMACKCPVVCSRAASLPEVGGDAVVYCNPHDDSDIAEKIEMVLTSKTLRRQIVAKGLERCRGFSWEKGGRELRRKLLSVIPNSQGREAGIV